MRSQWKRNLCTALVLMVLCFVPIAYADTDGTELQITDRTDTLVLQLGTEWAGAEFQLKLDTGLYPVPVVANEHGVLSMELGGSKNYTLTVVSRPEPDTARTAPAEGMTQAATPPTLHPALFFGGLAMVAGILIVFKKQKAHSQTQKQE